MPPCLLRVDTRGSSCMLAVGETLQGRYRIVREIGAGGMGTVYEGENLLIRRRVAIKVMRESAVDRSDLRARFELEARIASQIPSDHITEVLDLGELAGGQRFIVMEYLVGESLTARLERTRRVPPRELLGLARQVLVALGAAHRAGVIHRDIKPDNVFILSEKAGQRDFVKLLDFGVSKLRPSGAEIPLTQSGVFVGTPGYMAPEQVGGTQPSPAWDLYAVGVILYRGLTGEMPFQSEHVHDLMCKVVLGNFPPPSERVADLDPALDALVCRAMSRFPEQRFQSAEQFISALDAHLAAEGERAALAKGSGVAPQQTSNRMPSTARWEVSGEGPVVPLPTVPTPVSSELGVGTEHSPKWLGWAAAALLLLVGLVFFVSWRADHHVDDTVTQVHAAEPASRAATVLADPPAPNATAVPSAALPAPAVPLVRSVEEPGRAIEQPGVIGSVTVAPVVPSSDKAPERRKDTLKPIPKQSTAPRRAASGPKPPNVVAAPHPPDAPSPHADDLAKSRPDWGY